MEKKIRNYENRKQRSKALVKKELWKWKVERKMPVRKERHRRYLPTCRNWLWFLLSISLEGKKSTQIGKAVCVTKWKKFPIQQILLDIYYLFWYKLLYKQNKIMHIFRQDCWKRRVYEYIEGNDKFFKWVFLSSIKKNINLKITYSLLQTIVYSSCKYVHNLRFSPTNPPPIQCTALIIMQIFTVH